MSLALGAPGYPWLSWVSLLPLFLAIRVFTPRVAMLAGGLWGGCLYVFSIAGGGTAILPGIQSCALLVTVPAVYAWVGTRLTRRVGFSPLLLGLGWVGVEFALAPLGLRHGLLASAQGGGALFQLVGGLLGYCFVAFLVAFATALLLSVATDARLKIPQPRYIPRSDNDRGWLITLTSSYVPLVAVLPAQPRAPPGWAQVSRAPR